MQLVREAVFSNVGCTIWGVLYSMGTSGLETNGFGGVLKWILLSVLCQRKETTCLMGKLSRLRDGN